MRCICRMLTILMSLHSDNPDTSFRALANTWPVLLLLLPVTSLWRARLRSNPRTAAPTCFRIRPRTRIRVPAKRRWREELVEAVPAHEHLVPLADAVTTAEGQAEPLLLARHGSHAGHGASPVLVGHRAVRGRAGIDPRAGRQRCDAGADAVPDRGRTRRRAQRHRDGPARAARDRSGKLSGAIIGVPIVNVQGFRRGSRYSARPARPESLFPRQPDGQRCGHGSRMRCSMT